MKNGIAKVPRTAVARLFTREIEPLASLTRRNHMSFAQEQGWAFREHVGRIDVTRAPHWSKLLFIGKLLAEFDRVVWLDCDAIVFDPAKAASALNQLNQAPHTPVGLFTQPRFSSLNSGIMVFDRAAGACRVLGEIYFSYPDSWECAWYDQQAFIEHKRWNSVDIVVWPHKDVVCYSDEPFNDQSAFYHAYGPNDKHKEVSYVMAKQLVL